MWYTADLVFDGTRFLPRHYIEVSASGQVRRLTDQPPGEAVKALEGIISPGFINSHLHLELSPLQDKIRSGTGLPGFINQLQQIRQQASDDPGTAIKEAVEYMAATGTVAAADIANDSITVSIKSVSNLRWHTFVELFGVKEDSAAELLERGKALAGAFTEGKNTSSVTLHAPYSISKRLAELVLDHAGDGAVISIHNQENAEEDLFLKEGKGCFADLLQGMNIDTSRMTFRGNSCPALITDMLKPGQRVMFVHNTFTPQSVFQELASHPQVFWCFCPGANLFIENTLPDVPGFYRADANIVFGTDSLASNQSLDLLQELKIVSEKWPELDTGRLLQSITSVPAALFSFDGLGSLTPGTTPGLVHITGTSPGGKLLKSSRAVRLN